MIIAVVPCLAAAIAGAAFPSGTGVPPRPSAPEALTVFAAASLTDAFRALGHELERRQPGLTVRFSFAGSQQLAFQLAQGAGADVFASADQRWMSHLTVRHLIAGTPAVFAHNGLAVIVPKKNPGRIARLEDLARPGLKLVLAAEAVPVGAYSRQVVRRLATAPGFPAGYDRLVLANTVSQEENVKAVAAKVQLGEADAGLVYRSDVTAAVAPAVRVIDIPDAYNVLASYPIAVLAGARNPTAARAFVALVSSPDGQRILRRYGLLAADAGKTPATEPDHP